MSKEEFKREDYSKARKGDILVYKGGRIFYSSINKYLGREEISKQGKDKLREYIKCAKKKN